jgi:glutathione synthase/RimK-type ligase-like ATP-grasp enzyme
MKKNKVLILTGGKARDLLAFSKEGKSLGIDLKLASFDDLEYDIGLTGAKFSIKIGKQDLTNFDVIYFRLLGKSTENASIVADYAKRKKIKVVDRLYEEPKYIRLPLPKGLETMLLFENGIAVPHTLFLTLRQMVTRAPQQFGFPFVVKGTNGKRGRAVWSPGING